MNELMKPITDDLGEGPLLIKESADAIKFVVDATRGITAPQAALAIGGLAALAGVVVYGIAKVSELAGCGLIKEIDAKGGKIVFASQSHVAA